MISPPEVKKFQLEPGETLVLRYKEKLTTEQRVRIQTAITPLIPAGNRVLVLDNGTEIGRMGGV